MFQTTRVLKATGKAMLAMAVFVSGQLAYAADSVQPDRPKVGIAFGGGGTRGVAEVGVLKVLEEAGIPIDYIAGTSMGAVVGGLYASGMTSCQLEQALRDKKMLKAFHAIPLKLRFALTPICFLPRVVGHHSYEGLYRGDKFRKHINKTVSADCVNIEDMKIPFVAVACDLLKGEPHVIRTGTLGEALQATCAVPFFRRPVMRDGKLLADGGIICNVPIRQVREMGADIVIAINVDEGIEPLTEDRFRHLYSVTKRASAIMIAKMDEADLKEADLVIQPNTTGIGLLSFKDEEVARALREGEEAARKALPAIRTLLNAKGVLAKTNEGRFQTVQYQPNESLVP